MGVVKLFRSIKALKLSSKRCELQDFCRLCGHRSVLGSTCASFICLYGGAERSVMRRVKKHEALNGFKRKEF